MQPNALKADRREHITRASCREPWQACARNNGAPADSVAITVTYTYRGRTPLRMLIPMFDQFTMSDRTVMAMNANR